MLTLMMMLGALGAGDLPVDLASRVETGWTSNATESVGGTPDLYLKHSHDLSITGSVGPLSLRGGLAVDQQVFRQHEGENDLSVTAGLEAALAVSDSVVLRAGYALTHKWTGEIVDLGPLAITLRSPRREHEILGEVVIIGPDRRVVVGVDMLAREPGPTSFEGLPLPPLRLDPRVTQTVARIDGEWAMDNALTGLAGLHWTISHVPNEDRIEYGREPAEGARLAGGLRLRQGPVTAEVKAGMDLVWPQAAPQVLRQLPYLDGSLTWAVSEALTLTARGATGIEFLEPVDGVAGRIVEGEVGGRLALLDTLSLSAGLAMSMETGLYDEVLQHEQRSVRGGIAWAFAPYAEIGIAASHAWHEQDGAAYAVSTLGLTLAGKV